MLRPFLYSIILFASSAAFAGNLLPGDSSFETGTDSLGLEPRAGRIQISLDDKAAPPHGKQCVKLYPVQGTVISKPFEIKESQDGKVFTFSLFAKADRDGVPATLFITRYDGGQPSAQSKITLSKNWKSYSLSSALKPGDIGLGITVGGNSTVWLDAFQLEQNEKPSEYVLTPELSIGASIPSNNNYVFFRDEEIPITIRVINFKNKKLDDPAVSISVTDCFGKTVSEIRKNVDAKNFEWNYKFKPEKLGWFKITAKLDCKGKSLSETVRAVSVVDQPVKIKEGRWPFCGNCHTYVMYPKGLERIGGLNWADIGIHWEYIEKTKGRYNKLPDLGRFHDAGMKCKLTIGALAHGVPWAWDENDIADCKKNKRQEPRYGFLPSKENMESWRNFIRYVVSSYKGKVDIIEFGGEDDLLFGGNSYYVQKQKNTSNTNFGKLTGGPDYDRYAEMIRIACEETRKIDPDVKIGIVRPSGGDCTIYGYTFSTPAIKVCKNLFDLFPLDPYCYPRNIGPGQPETAVPEDFLPGSIGRALETCKVNGNGQNVYISEFGYAMDYNVAPDSTYSMDLTKRMVRSYLVARMSPRVELLHWFHPNSYGCIEGGKYHYGLWRFGMPLPSVPAYSAVARIVENVEDSKELNLGGDSKAVVFKKDGRSDAAVWFVRGSGKLKLKEIPEGLEISDFMGNPVHIEKPSFLSKIFNAIDLSDSSVCINIDEFPVYFSLEGKDSFDKLANILSKSAMICKPVKTSFSTPRKDKGILQLKNIAGKDIDAVATIDGSGKNLSLKSGETINIEVPVNKNSIEVSVDCGENYEKVNDSYQIAFESCPSIDFKGKIDADLSKWKGRPFIAMDERSQIMPPDPWIDYRGPEQFSAKVYTGWDEKYFYMAAEVKDESHNNRFPGEIYKGDCIQFAFDPLANGGTRGYGKDDKELGIALIDNKAAVAQWTKNANVWKSSEYAVKRDDKGKKTFYEMRIPLAILGIPPQKGSAFGFNFVIFNDDTGAGANYYYQLAPGITGGKNPAMFRKFVLE